jgi:hypothetical protein
MRPQNKVKIGFGQIYGEAGGLKGVSLLFSWGDFSLAFLWKNRSGERRYLNRIEERCSTALQSGFSTRAGKPGIPAKDLPAARQKLRRGGLLTTDLKSITQNGKQNQCGLFRRSTETIVLLFFVNFITCFSLN